jgi:hypothetical protein
MAYRQGRTPEHQHPQQGRAQNEANQEGVEQGSKGVEKGEPRNTSLWLAVSRGDSRLRAHSEVDVLVMGLRCALLAIGEGGSHPAAARQAVPMSQEGARQRARLWIRQVPAKVFGPWTAAELR